jgi:hypothetical protein
MQSHLTPSKKKRRSQGDPLQTSMKRKPFAAKREPDWLDWEDAVLSHCRTLEVFAALLFHTGRNDGVTMDVVNGTGGLMMAEVSRLRKLVHARPGRGAK